jgi:quinol monooxygenase YgiN
MNLQQVVQGFQIGGTSAAWRDGCFRRRNSAKIAAQSQKGVTPMIGVVATIKVKEGQGAEFEKVATELVRKVNENEKGCLLYQLYHGEEPNTYVFMERYKDQAAVDEHRGTDYFKTLGRAMGAFMDGRPDVKRFKQVG